MSRPTRSLKKKDGQWISGGYRFDEDDVANQMAYLFAGQEGQKRVKTIREEAEKIQEPEQRKQYIEQEVKKKAAEVDEGFQKGLTDIIKGFSTSGKDKSGSEAGKDMAVSLMKGLGLNVNPDNVQTHYSPGPPQCFQIAWVNRPTQELKDENSEINQLSKCYANSLSPEAQQGFNEKWDRHITNARNDGPKIDKTTFEMDSAKSWSDFKSQVKQEHEQSAQMTSSKTLDSDERSQPQL
ncbi:hypothetical protein [uncultured Legionella sp.]|uniref:hypothetical protein n=1 Tax=uncultured Legionella sp. TaxID=210934 RepID=UPI002639D1EE|nr:hypothetical protein [uncultured Legionella sp.]